MKVAVEEQRGQLENANVTVDTSRSRLEQLQARLDEKRTRLDRMQTQIDALPAVQAHTSQLLAEDSEIMRSVQKSLASIMEF